MKWGSGTSSSLGLPPGPPGLGSTTALPARADTPGSDDADACVELALGAGRQLFPLPWCPVPDLLFAVVVPAPAPPPAPAPLEQAPVRVPVVVVVVVGALVLAVAFAAFFELLVVGAA